MYILKQQPEDFVVNEESNINVTGKGRYSYFLMKKRERNTLGVVKELSKQLRIREKDIGFAGSKDKHAVTTQVISVFNVSKEKVLNVNIDKTEFKFLGYGNKPVSLGDLSGNHFEIVVRNLEKFSVDSISYCENYFDEQRFSLHNVEIGRELIKKDFEKACRLIDDTHINQHLEKKKNDFIGALKKLPIRLLRMYVNAYQSYLWNETLSSYLCSKGKVLKEVDYSLGKLIFVSNADDFKGLEISLIGFGTSVEGEIGEIIKEIMKEENLDFRSFVIKQIPELSLEGEFRKAFVEINNLEIGKTLKDNLNAGMKKVKLKFSLPKGSYATMVVKRIVKV